MMQKDLESKSVSLRKELVDVTAFQIRDFYDKNSLNEIPKCIADFYEKCPKETLRAATIKLIGKITQICSKDKSNYCIQQILAGLDTYLKKKDEEFVKDVFNQTISKELWKSCITFAFQQDIKTCEFALDFLFHLRKPDSDDLKESLYTRIKNLPERENAEEWIQTFNLDCTLHGARTKQTMASSSTTAFCALQKLLNYESVIAAKKTMASSTVAANEKDYLSSQRLVGPTFVLIQDDIVDGSFDPKCVADFYNSCSNDSLRGATMELIVKVNGMLFWGDVDLLPAIRNILFEFEAFLKGKDNAIIDEIKNGYVVDKLWDKCFQIILSLDIKDCKTSLDVLFHICKPETKKRCLMVYSSIQKFLSKEKTVNKGNEWIHIFGLDLEKLKIRSNDPDEDDKHVPSLINPLRRATMKKILKVYEDATSDDDLLTTVHIIYKRFERCLNDKDDKEFVKEAISTEVSDDLWINAWEKCFEAASNRPPAKCTLALDQLFSLKNPENDVRKALLEAGIRKLLNEKDTFVNGLRWITAFDLIKLKEEEFEKIFYNSILFESVQPFTQFMPCTDDRFRCLRLLDDCLRRAENNQLQSDMEKTFIKHVTIEMVPEIIDKFSKTFKVDIEKHKFYACQILTVQKIKNMCAFLDRNYFELYALEDLKSKDEKYKLDFLNVISDDQKYAYCWAKYLQLPTSKMPKFLQNCEHFEPVVLQFRKALRQRIHTPVDKDQIETCHFWKKPYQLITVITPKAFNNFVDKYLINSKPKIIGIDCEARRYKAVVLQLATTEWAALIDIQGLFKKLSRKQWENFFALLFNPNITLVGFAFTSDFQYLGHAFPYLPAFFQRTKAKVLCLQKLSDEMIEDEKCSKIYLQKPARHCGLATLTKAVLGLSLDKTEQQSEWHIRPLTQFQKIYAVTDALIVVLLKDEIEKRLKKQIGIKATVEMMKKAYDSH